MSECPSVLPLENDLDLLRSSLRGMLKRSPSLRQMASAGLLGLLTPEDQGGAGWRPVEASTVAEELGRALSPLPWIGSLLVAAALASEPGLESLASAVLAGSSGGAVGRSSHLHWDGSHQRVCGQIVVTHDSKPDLVLVTSQGNDPILVDCRSHDVIFELRTDFDTTRATGLIQFDLIDPVIVGAHKLRSLEAAAVLLGCADSLGALSATFELLNGYLSDRRAFKRPIASFQVVQHRLANLAILEAACRALVRRAATALADPVPGTQVSLIAAHSYFVRHVGPALDDCIQLAGGIGFTWDFPIHHAMRRVMSNSFRVTPQYGPDLIAGDTQSKDAEDGPWRSHVRAIIRQYSPFEAREGHRAPTSETQETALRRWYRIMYDEGLLGAAWPVEWGGRPGHDPQYDLVVTEELIAARAPRPIDQVQLASHLLLKFGTAEQKGRYLPRIRSADDIWCQLFSEPDCGSDLAGIRTRGECLEDGTWRVVGQKTWTTDAHWAQMGVALVRTTRTGRRHDGLTAFLVPMDSPGIDIRPKMTMGGAFEFNDVFLDGVVLASDQILGAVNQGWTVAMAGLEVERFGVGGNVEMLRQLLISVARLVEAIRLERLEGAQVRVQLQALTSDAEAARAFVAEHIDRTLAGAAEPTDAAISKVLYSETYQRIARFGAELVAQYEPVADSVESEALRLIDAWLWARAQTIAGGSSEVMRNVIARRRLRLPM